MSAPPIDLKFGGPDQTESSDTSTCQPTGHISRCQVTFPPENCRAGASTSQPSLLIGSPVMSIPETEPVCGTLATTTSAIHNAAKSASCTSFSNEDDEEWTDLSEEEEEEKEPLSLLESSDTHAGQSTGHISGYQCTSISENCSIPNVAPETTISFDAAAATLAPHTGIILGGPNTRYDPFISQPIRLYCGIQATVASQICSTTTSIPRSIMSLGILPTLTPHTDVILGGPNTRSSDPSTNQIVELDSGTLVTSASQICSTASSSLQTIVSFGAEATSTTETGLVSKTLTVSIPCTGISVASTVQSTFGMQPTFGQSGRSVETSITSSQYSLAFGASSVTVRPAPSHLTFGSPSGFSFGSQSATSILASSGLPCASASSSIFRSSGLGLPAGSNFRSPFATSRILTVTQPTFIDTSSFCLGFGTFRTKPSTGPSEPIETGLTGFGSNTDIQTMGTTIKFTPTTGTDTVWGNGRTRWTRTIITKHHCITCMKEYEAKSLEELRLEDYMLNRNGPQQAPQQSGLFGISSQPSLFGSATSTSTGGGNLFQGKPLFGGGSSMGFGATAATSTATTTGSFVGFETSSFGTASGSATPVLGSSNQQPTDWFSKPYLGAVSTTVTSIFSFSTTTTSNSPGTSAQPKTLNTCRRYTGKPRSSNWQLKGLFSNPAEQGAVSKTTRSGFSFNTTTPSSSVGVSTSQKAHETPGVVSIFSGLRATGSAFSFGTTTTMSNQLGASIQLKTSESFKSISSKNVETDPVEHLTDIELSKIWSILECPVCLDVVLPPVYQCATGHHVCSNCWENLPSCPLCKSYKSMITRNFVAEAILELVNLPCRFRVNGCKNVVLLTKKIEHENSCPHKKFQCPVSCCREKQNYQTLGGHLSQKHGLVVTELTDPYKLRHKFSKTIEINNLSSLVHGFLISDWGLFLLRSKTTKSKTLLWMQMIPAPGKSSNFSFKIDVVDHLDRRGVSYTGTVALLDRSVDEIQEDDCLHMIDIMLKSLQRNGLKITVHISANNVVVFPLD